MVHEAARGVQSEFNLWFVDEATLGDSPKRVHDDLGVLLESLRAISFKVNGRKCELAILNDRATASRPEGLEAEEVQFRGLLSVARVVEACDLSLLTDPPNIQGIPGTIHEKREVLERMTSKLKVLNPYQTFDLL